MLHHALFLHLLEHEDTILALLLLIGEGLDIIVHILNLGIHVEHLLSDITRLHQLVVLVAHWARVEALFGPLVQLHVQLFLQQDVDLILTKCVDVAEKDDVLALDALVGVSVDLLALLERLSHVLNIPLHRLTHSSLVFVQISLTNLVIFGLLEHVYAMQALNTSLQLVVVIQMIVENFVDSILELPLVVGLAFERRNR